MKKIVTFLLCTISVSAFTQKQNKSTEDKRFTGLDTAFARVLKDWHAAGFAVAVVEKNKVVYAKGFGYRDVEKKLPATANTLYAIGSCSKAFTSSILGLLQKDGSIDFDKPVRDYLPQLKFYNDNMNDKIIVRDLMCHRTGLPRHDYSWYYFVSHSKDSLISRIQYMEPSAGLREKWQYNNFMFLAQGVIAEKLTGISWEQNVKQKILDPLGMVRSNFNVDSMAVSSDAAFGYQVKQDSIIKKMDYYDIAGMSPAGAINSSVTEMANWVITWINGGKFNGKEILPAQYVNEAMSSQMVIGGGLPSKENPDLYFANYGFGWFLSSYKGHFRAEHGGNINGFSASTSFFPSDSVGIIVLTNQDGSSVPSVVRNIIADRMLGLKYKDWESYLKGNADSVRARNKAAEATAVANKKPNTTSSHALKDYEGIYSNKGYGSVEVLAKDDSLFVLLGTHTWWLKHAQYDIFEPVEKDVKDGYDTTQKNDPIQFQMNTSGDIESVQINFEPSLKPLAFTKTPKAKEVTKDELQKYVGEYELGGTTIKVYIKGEKTLYVFVPGQPEYELIPTEKNKFAIKVVSGYFVLFATDDKDTVTDLSFIQPNGTFKATRKK